MAKTHFKTEIIEFENGHHTTARALVVKKYRLFMDVFSGYQKLVADQIKVVKKVSKEIEAKQKAGEEFNDEEYFLQRVEEELGAQVDTDDQYVDTLVKCSVIALKTWGVKDETEGDIAKIDQNYVEDNLDLHELTKICEIAGSMKLGDVSGDAEGKA